MAVRQGALKVTGGALFMGFDSGVAFAGSRNCPAWSLELLTPGEASVACSDRQEFEKQYDHP